MKVRDMDVGTLRALAAEEWKTHIFWKDAVWRWPAFNKGEPVPARYVSLRDEAQDRYTKLSRRANLAAKHQGIGAIEVAS